MSETDQYDTLLRSMEEGLIISVNESTEHAVSHGELEVLYSYDGKTWVAVKNSQREYAIVRRDDDEIRIHPMEKDGLTWSGSNEVLTIEVLGLK